MAAGQHPAPVPPPAASGEFGAAAPRTPAEALSRTLSATCLPFVADRVPADEAVRSAGLASEGPAPSFPWISHETGRAAYARWPGLEGVRLHEEPVGGARPLRSCAILMRTRDDGALRPALEAVLRSRSGVLVPLASALPGRPTYGLPGALVVVSRPDEVARYGQMEIDVFEPADSAP